MSAFALAVTNEPATRTLPFPRRVAVAPSCPLRMLAALSHVFVAGSYSSAEARPVESARPPTTRTLPFPRRVAVWLNRAWAMLAAGDHVFVVGSYSSHEARATPPGPCPPASRTSPFPRRVAVWSALAVAIDGAGDHGLSTPAAGAVMDRTNEPTSAAAPHAARNLRAILIPPSASQVAHRVQLVVRVQGRHLVTLGQRRVVEHRASQVVQGPAVPMTAWPMGSGVLGWATTSGS